MRGIVVAWGILGVVALLGRAVWRLWPLALDAVRGGLSPVQWLALVLWVAFMAHAEGYRGFHKRVSPRVVARALYLPNALDPSRPKPLRLILAPFYCMSLFDASPRGVRVARSVFGGVLVLILLVRTLPQPWRGIIDAGVVIGLGIGIGSILYYTLIALTGRPLPVGPDLPDTENDVIDPTRIVQSSEGSSTVGGR